MRGIDVSVYRPADHKPEPEPEGPTVTEPDPEYEGWSDEDVAAEYAKVAAEHQRRQRVASSARTVTTALAAYQAAQGIRDGQRFRPVTGYLDAIPAGATRWFEDGTIRRNISGAPLAHGPDEAPDAWEIVAEDQPPPDAPDPDEYPAWEPDLDIEAGSVWSHNGALWEATQDHRSQPHWAPTDGTYLWRRV